MSHEQLLSEHLEQVERRDWGVAIGVSEECEREAFRIRDTILDRGVELDVALERNPHITLFQGEFTTSSLKAIEAVIVEVLDEFFQNFQEELLLQMESDLYLRPGNNNLFWNVKSTEWLTALHVALDEKLRLLPEWGMMQQFRDRIAEGKLTTAEIAHVHKYGVLSAGSLFLPHITIGRLKSSTDFDRIKDIAIQPTSFPARQLMTGMIDRYGRIESVKAMREMN